MHVAGNRSPERGNSRGSPRLQVRWKIPSRQKGGTRMEIVGSPRLQVRWKIPKHQKGETRKDITATSSLRDQIYAFRLKSRAVFLEISATSVCWKIPANQKA
ncbi:hypothetical protein Dsin_008956 [Dipteronia sinensis]|uniref:Uncharacterized protein n=1 Tax=Dipteronia sinensis TaxID=43782 RepID=A0AAE0EBA6_9ROSI|nr:hypothetical protein Dsin_008956 [Dipteronia sinensis]